MYILPERSVIMDVPAFCFFMLLCAVGIYGKRSAYRAKNAGIYYAFNTKNAYICTQ